MKYLRSLLRATPGSSQLIGLAATLLLAVLVGGLVAGLILVRSRGSATAQPTAPAATLAPGPTQTAKPVPIETPQSVPGIQGLVSIHMLDASNGWAITGQNHILRTTDGASHWQDVTPPSIDPPQANYANLTYDFLSPSVAWVYSFVRDANDTGGTTKYYRTTNGGQTWRHQTLPLPPSFSGQVVTNPPTFFNAQDGMLPVIFIGAGIDTGEVYVTHDAGATWQSTSFIEAAEYDFINANQGWATDGAATGGSTLYATSDGGRHWTKLPAGPNVHDIEVLNFVSAEVGWAIDNPHAQFALGPTILLKTTNGGKTWTAVPSAPLYKIR